MLKYQWLEVTYLVLEANNKTGMTFAFTNSMNALMEITSLSARSEFRIVRIPEVVIGRDPIAHSKQILKVSLPSEGYKKTRKRHHTD